MTSIDFLEMESAFDRPVIQQREWMKSKVMTLVTTTEALKKVVDECIKAGLYALDLECEGVDNRVLPGPQEGTTVDKIVGYCLSPDGIHGYYIPVRHRDERGQSLSCNIKPRIAAAEIRRLAESKAKAIFHHGKFDQEFLEFGEDEPIGNWDDPDHWEDTHILAYIRNTRERNKGLKFLAGQELGCEMIELDELFSKEDKAKAGGKLNFSVLDPTWEPCIWYACSDAICTYNLYIKIKDEAFDPQPFGVSHGKDQADIYKIEKMCVSATRWMERCRIFIDRSKVAELIQLGQEEWFASLEDVYEEASKILSRNIRPAWYRIMRGLENNAAAMKLVFNPKIMDPTYMEVREEADRLGKQLRMDPMEPNAKGVNKIQTINREVTSLVNPKKKEPVAFPIVYDVTIPADLGLLLRELGVTGLATTEKSGQIKTSKDELDRVIEEAGDQFPFMAKIKRFRETAKALGTNLFPLWEDTKYEEGAMHSPDGTVKVGFNAHKVDTGRFSTPKPSDDAVFQGQVRWNLQSIPAGYDKNKPACMLRIREVISCRPGYFIVAIDFSGVELRIVTNLSREPKWITEFFRCSECGQTFDRGDGRETPEAPPAFCPKCGSDKIGDLHTLTALAVYGEDIKDTKEFKGKRQKSKCVHPDTLIIKDGVLTRIGSLPFGEADDFYPLEDSSTIQGPAGAIPLLESYNGGVKPLFHVVTRRGIVTCSDQHPFSTRTGLLSISEGLCPGMALEETPISRVGDNPYPTIDIPLHLDVPVLQYTPNTPNNQMAYAAGAYQGDGCKAGTRSVSIAHGSIKKTDLLGVPYTQWQQILSESLTQAGFRPVPKERFVYFGSQNTIFFMECLGLLTRTGHRTLRVPPWILSAGSTAIKYYLAGLWDTDGSINKDGTGAWTTKDIIFAGQVAALLHAIGIKPRVEPCWNKLYNKYYWRVHAFSAGMHEISQFMRHPGKLGRIKPPRQVPWLKPNEVLMIIPAGDGQCYDVHVGSEDHTFWCNGLITRNSLNFALVYGGGGQAAQRAVGVDKDEGWRLKRQFDQTYKGLEKWWEIQKNFARKYGYVVTAFGRRYLLPDIKHEMGGFRAKAERNAVNGPIQGLSADITKLAMALIYRAMKARGWLAKVRMIVTIHDELVFELAEDVAEEGIEIINAIMTKSKPLLKLRFPVPLKCDIEFGLNWTVPYNLTEMTWNKAKPGAWTSRWVRVFPKAYLNYLKCGGTPVDSEGNSSPLVEKPPESNGGGTPSLPEDEVKVEPGIPYTYIIHTSRLTIGTLDSVANLIHRCAGRGTQPLRLQTEKGESLWDGSDILVSATEFSVLAREYGV